MLIRISLLIAILTATATAIICHFCIRPQIQRLIAQQKAEAARVAFQTARADKAEARSREVAQKLASSEANAATLAKENQVLKNERIQLSEHLEEAKSKLTSAKQELARWAATGVTPDAVAVLGQENRILGDTLSRLEASQKALVRENENLKSRLDIIDVADEPVLPPVKGKVLVVDPKWNFVVLDLGQQQGLKKNGVLMISRDSNLVGKIRVSRVEADRSIANLLPGWNFAEIREGDQVFN